MPVPTPASAGSNCAATRSIVPAISRATPISPRAEGRPEEVWRLSLEIPTETASVERFARQLTAVAETLTGEATLLGA